MIVNDSNSTTFKVAPYDGFVHAISKFAYDLRFHLELVASIMKIAEENLSVPEEARKER